MMRGVDNTMDTITAAATAIASAEDDRARNSSVQKRRWGSCFSISWCFGSHKQSKRIGHAVLVPEPNPSTRTEAPAVENQPQAPSIVLPFIAPPSSPASFIQSEPPSATQSPAGLLSFTSVSANMYSPTGPASIFAIGPYAHETQLVSPPVFSTFTTEPSTAPFTPPPESVHLTTPSSPEVPFARLVGPNNQNGEAGQRFPISHYEFQSYHLYPGSPAGQLISPSSGISGSGTSSPLPDGDFFRAGRFFLELPSGPSKHDRLSPREWESHRSSGAMTPDAVGSKSGTLTPDAVGSKSGTLTPDAVRPKSGTLTPDAVRPKSGTLTPHVMVLKSGTLTPDAAGSEFSPDATRLKSRDGGLLERQHSDLGPLTSFSNGARNDESTAHHRVSFEITAEDVVRCVEKRRNAFMTNCRDGHSSDIATTRETCANTAERDSVDGDDGYRHQKHRSITLGSAKEFNFDSADGGISDSAAIRPDWWTGDKVTEKESAPSKNWSFFLMQQAGVS